MTPLWTSDEIAAVCGGVASETFAVSGVTFDSREVDAGFLFIAMKGEATDGHKFLDSAIDRGAAGLLVSEATPHPHVLVADTFAALEALARAARARTGATVIGVTGSAGKTGTKEALAAALDRIEPGRTHKSVKSYNNHTGVPLSLARMPRESRFAVLEMGMNHAGELAHLTTLVRPHVAMVTTVTMAHAGFFASEEAIADAKGEIFQGLEPGGTAIVPYDNTHRDRLIAAAKPYAERIVTFGSDRAADVHPIDTMRTQRGTFVTAKAGAKQLSYTIAFPGAHWVANSLGILAAVDAAGGDLALAGLALAELEGLAGRGARFRVPLDGGDLLVIDESYNANIASMTSTLAVLGEEPGRHIAVLGEMRELGDFSDQLHADLAAPIRAANVETVILVGKAMEPLADVLEREVNMVHVPDADTAHARLTEVMRPGDAVLIKGSNGVGLARVVAHLKELGIGAR